MKNTPNKGEVKQKNWWREDDESEKGKYGEYLGGRYHTPC
jgi:hypothetical protein